MMIQKSPNIIYGGYLIYRHWDDWDDGMKIQMIIINDYYNIWLYFVPLGI